jgi:hypothetical protein
MRTFWQSAKATFVAVPALWLFFLLLFPPRSLQEFQEVLGWFVILSIYFGIPLFLAIWMANVIFNRQPVEPTCHNGNFMSSPVRMAVIGACISGLLAGLVNGIVVPVFLILTIAGAIVGYIVGLIRS